MPLSYANMISVVDGQTVATAILAVGALMIVPRLAGMGVRWIQDQVGDRAALNDAYEDELRRSREY